MLDQLVESKNNARENNKRGKIMASTFALVTVLSLSAVVWSLFAKDFGMGGENMELSTLVAPLAPAASEPDAEPQPEKPAPNPKPDNQTTRQTNTLRISENPLVPDKISVLPSKQSSRPNAPFKISSGIETDAQSSAASNLTRGMGSENGTGISSQPAQTRPAETVKMTIPKPPPIKDEPPKPPKKNVTVTEGVINGKATSLPKPPYPPAAKAVGAGGAVSVQVKIDEQGYVTSAKAISGHPLLRNAAESAARNAKFSPTYLSKQPVKVVGVIIYNFQKN